MSVIAVSLVITVLCLGSMKNGDGSKSESENGSNETLNIRGFDTEKAFDFSRTDKSDPSFDGTESTEVTNNSKVGQKNQKTADIQVMRHKFLLLLLILSLLIGDTKIRLHFMNNYRLLRFCAYNLDNTSTGGK